MSSIVMVSTYGTKHYINDNQISEAFKELLDVGYSPIQASELAIDLVVARIEADELSSEDFIYSKSDYQTQLTFLSHFNSRKQHKCNQTQTPVTI
jgi:hypothetical protein